MWKNVKMTPGKRFTQTLRRRNSAVTMENLMKNAKKRGISQPEACCITLEVERRNIPPVFERRGMAVVDPVTYTWVLWESLYMLHL